MRISLGKSEGTLLPVFYGLTYVVSGGTGNSSLLNGNYSREK